MNTLDRVARLIKHYGSPFIACQGSLHGIFDDLDRRANITTGGTYFAADGTGWRYTNLVGRRLAIHENHLGGTGKFHFWLGSEG